MQTIGRIPALTLIGATACLLSACESGSQQGGTQPQAAAPLTYPDGSPLPMTAWGDPDLRGMWPIMHLFATRLQRNPEFGERRFLTDEEWQAAQTTLERRDANYDREIESNKMGMGHWAETTTRTEATRLTSLISYPPDGQMPALTARGQELIPEFGTDDNREVFDSPQDDFDPWDRCITRGLPSSMLPYNYNNGIQIAQAPGHVVINLEMIHESRIVPIGAPPLDAKIKQWMGASRGYWDGPTLVVETANFNGEVAQIIVGIPGGPRGVIPSTPNMKTTERFTRVADDRIDYEITIEDPEVLTDKWTISYPMLSDPEYQFFEYACHEDNTAVRNFIETSRYERGLTPTGQPRE